jgi:hypothetical protein
MPSPTINAALHAWVPHQSAFAGNAPEYTHVSSRWRPWSVSAKSGMSLERAIRRRRRMTLFNNHKRSAKDLFFPMAPSLGANPQNSIGGGNRRKFSYSRKLANIQHNPRVQPAAVSPLRLRHPSTKSGLNGRPAVSVAKRMRLAATM